MKKKKKGLQGDTRSYAATTPSIGREPKSFAGPTRTGTDSTERREPATIDVCRGDCLKGGDHRQGFNPTKPATQTRGLPPVPSRTHTPMPPGRPLRTQCGRKAPAVLRYTPPRQVPGVSERHLCIPGCPKSARPSTCTVHRPATLPPTTRPKATARPLPAFCCHCCCTPAPAC